MTDSFVLIVFVVLVVALAASAWFTLRRRQSPRSSNSFTVRAIESSPRNPGTARQGRCDTHKPLWNSLTPREIEVAKLVTAGKRNMEIAHDLHISINTVESHLKHIYSKLDVHSRIELARVIRDLVD